MTKHFANDFHEGRMPYDDDEILNEVIEYLDYLETPNENFGGMAVCPFLKKERVTEGLMLRVWRPNEESFFNVLDEFVESDKSSAVLVCMDTGYNVGRDR